MTRRWKCAVALALCFVSFSAGWYWLSKPRRTLEKVLAAVRSIELGSTNLTTFENTLRSQGLHPEKSTVCQGSDCTYVYSTKNVAQAFLHSAPPSELVVNVTFSKDRASGIVVNSDIGEFGQVAHLRFRQAHEIPDTQLFKCPDRVCINIRRQSDGTPVSAYIVAPSVPTSQRNAVLDINSSCFSRLWGCRTLTALLPTIRSHA